MGAYGWKATIGFIGPPRTNETVLHEAIRLAPRGVSWCWSTMCLPEFGQFEFDEALSLAGRCAQELAERKVNIIVATGIPLITSKGPGYHVQLERELAALTGNTIPVSDDLTVNSLRIGNIAAQTVDIAAGKTLTLASGGLLFFSTASQSIGSAVNVGSQM